MGDYGFKVSRDTFDVKTATDRQLGMSSAFNHFKISDTALGTQSLSAHTSGTISVTLSNTYVGFLCYVKNEINEWNYANPPGNDEANRVWADSYINNGTLKIELHNNTGSTQSVKYRYLLFIDQA